MKSLTLASMMLGALSEYTYSGIPKMEKVWRKAMTVSMAVSSFVAWSITKRERSSSIRKTLVAPVKWHGCEMDI
jgi:hypothetical protein